MDNNLLKQLVAQHRRVVIPDFGAFLKKETPEGEELVFSPFLRKDDGVVTNAVVSEYGVEPEDAQAMISEFVIYLRQALATSGQYQIDGVGTLTADANGTISLKKIETPEPAVAEPVPVEPEPVPEPAPQPEPQPIPQQIQQTPAGFPRPAQPQAAAAAPGITRPQSIQVQGQPAVQQPVRQPQPVATPPMPGQMPTQTAPYPVRNQPAPAGYQQPVPGGQPPFPRNQPVPPQPVRRQPVPGQMPLQQGQPLRNRQSPMPPQPGQPARNGQPPVPPMPRQTPPPMGAGVPPRGPKDPAQAQRMGNPNRPAGPAGPGAPGGPGGPNGRLGRPPRRPVPPRRRPPKTKTDIWLIVAIIAALIVIAIMIYGFINTGKNEIDMDAINAAMEPLQDTTTVIDIEQPEP